MLSQLHIENVAVIENADLELDNGFNVLTGETGAGKSILIDAINLVLGERSSKDIVRSGASRAHVTALFTDVSKPVCKRLEEFGFSCDEDGSLLISRDISADGRGSCHISGRPATVAILREIGRMLVNIHGQHENQALFSQEKHSDYLDRYAADEELLSAYSECYARTKRLASKLSGIHSDKEKKARQLDLLRYQINEINAADLKENEEEDLKARESRIQNTEKITEAVHTAYSALRGNEAGGAQELTAEAAEALNDIVSFYPELKSIAERIANLSYELDDCCNDLRHYTDQEDYDPKDLEYIEQRLDTIYRLKLKYGGSIQGILRFRDTCENQLSGIENADAAESSLKRAFEAAKGKMWELSKKLSARRTKAAEEMEKKIMHELSFLDMPEVKFKVQLNPLPEPASRGGEAVEFLISANPGSPLLPLSKIASGGEISRVMLAIKTVLADSDDIETLIFDEIDTGVSGRAAQKIGMKLRQVAGGRQVICVTHLAQIAAQAGKHILIEKTVVKGKTFTRLKALDFEGRKHELARIMGGLHITDLALQNAEEMLRIAGVKS